MGNVYRATGRTGEAIVVLERAVTLVPNSDEGHRRMADVYLAANQTDNALKACQRAIDSNPHYWLELQQARQRVFPDRPEVKGGEDRADRVSVVQSRYRLFLSRRPYAHNPGTDFFATVTFLYDFGRIVDTGSSLGPGGRSLARFAALSGDAGSGLFCLEV